MSECIQNRLCKYNNEKIKTKKLDTEEQIIYIIKSH